MLNIIKSEWYKVLHRKCTIVFFLVFAVGGFFMNFVLHFLGTEQSGGIYGNKVMEFWVEAVCILSWFLVYMVAQIVHSNESKTGVLKNTVSFGFDRVKLYIARFITQLMLLVGSIVIVTAMVILGNQVFNGGCTSKVLTDFLLLIVVTSILWVGALSLAHALAMCLNSNTTATVIYLLYFFLGNSLIQAAYEHLPNNQILSFMNKYEIFLFASNTGMQNKVRENLWLYFVIGGIYFVVSFAIGVFVYRRKEVK